VLVWHQVDRWRGEPFTAYAPVASAILVTMGVLIITGVMVRPRYPWLATRGLLVGVGSLYLLLAGWVLPGLNARKSERLFMAQVEAVAGDDMDLVSYKIPYRHAGFLYYGERYITDHETRESLWKALCSSHSEARWLVVEGPGINALNDWLGDVPLKIERDIGSRRAALVDGMLVCTSGASLEAGSAKDR